MTQQERTLTAVEEIQQLKQKELLKKISKLKASAKAKDELKQLVFFLTLFSAAVAGRVALQWVPSVEPIIPLAILAGILWGEKEGFTLGAGAFIVSNFFVWGIQGPWTIFQAMGAALPAVGAGVFARYKKPSTKDLILLSILGTIFFEIVMNISGAFMGIGILPIIGLFALPLYFLTSLPFTLAHIGSNIVFARVFAPLMKFRRKKDEFKIISINKLSPTGEHTNIRLYKSEN